MDNFELLKRTVEAKQLRESQIKAISGLLKRAHSKHIYLLEGLITRYAAELEAATKHHYDNPTQFGNAMKKTAHDYIEQAAHYGFERGLRDLQARGWIKKYDLPDNYYPKDVVLTAEEANDGYVNGFVKGIDSMTPDAIAARVQQYAHFLWPISEQAYKAALKRFSVFYGRLKESYDPNQPRDDHGRFAGGADHGKAEIEQLRGKGDELHKFFNDTSTLVRTNLLHITKDEVRDDPKYRAGLKPYPVKTAAVFMHKAYNGEADKRNPITVTKMPDGRYHVEDGNATAKAAIGAGWSHIPVKFNG